ncbi:hypothetical protein [Saccharothrix texasensis]|uniref:Uncharacterized protein n=1 Tax=Saccharothrix texasensis TaxID=103734 RepID=A0A3N1H592_9PSEU|nr:hypothetical protein [Saccharothrix texasensis]ROP37710.1 hypothetical protein EDD40_3031 [Saccharothrix texasensis]
MLMNSRSRGAVRSACGHVRFVVAHPARDESTDENTWDRPTAMLVRLMGFFAEFVDDGVRAIARVIRDDLPAVVDAEWPPPDRTGDHLHDLVARTTRWAEARGLL